MDFWDAISPMNNVRPAEQTGSQQRQEVKDLPVGDYEFLILDAETKMVGKEVEDKPIVQLTLRVLSGPQGTVGMEPVYNLWLTDEDSTARAFRDLATLGMSVRGSFPDLLRTFLGMLSGRKFRCSRRDNDKNGKHYANVYVNALSPGNWPQHDPGPTADDWMNTGMAEHDADQIPF